MDTLSLLAGAFERSLRARKRSPKTIRSYMSTVSLFAESQARRGRPLDVAEVTRGDVEEFIIEQLDTRSPATAALRYRSLQQFWRFLVEVGEIDESPMADMSPPTVPTAAVPVLSDQDLKALLAACAGKGFEERRDTALIRLFIATGVRLGEMAGVDLEHVDLGEMAMIVTGKGERPRWVTFGDKAHTALSLYLVARTRHPRQADPGLWIGTRGRLTESGIDQALRRRARQAGVEGLHVHRFRHTFAHRWLAAGGTEGDLQELAGWRSPQMLARYGASARSERARQAYRRIDVEGDV